MTKIMLIKQAVNISKKAKRTAYDMLHPLELYLYIRKQLRCTNWITGCVHKLRTCIAAEMHVARRFSNEISVFLHSIPQDKDISFLF